MPPSAFDFFTTSGRARPKPTTERPPRFDFGTDDGYAFFMKMGSLANADRLYIKGAAPFWNDMMTHGTDDAFWAARRVEPAPARREAGRPRRQRVVRREQPPWRADRAREHRKAEPKDIEPHRAGPVVARTVEPRLRRRARGPAIRVGDGQFFRDSLEYPFFEHYLKGEGTGEPALAEATIFETGTAAGGERSMRGRRRTPRGGRCICTPGKLSFARPASDEGGAGYEEYVSDPANPVPFLREKNTGMKPDYMALDQAAARRPDVLVYQSEPLAEDLTIAGSIKPNLFVSTTGTDGDWIVKVIDASDSAGGGPAGEAEGGFQELVRGDDAGEVQEQLCASGAVGAGEDDASHVRHG